MGNNKLKTLILLLICSVIAISISVYNERTIVKEIEITLAESSLSVPSSLSFIAKAKGFWKKQGLNVNVASFAAGRLAVDAMLNGQAQFATSAETPIATGAFRHNSYGVIAEMMNTTTETKVVARRDSGISSPDDLREKKIGVFIGTQAEYFLDVFLTHNNLIKSEVEIVNLQPSDAITALVNHDIDAMAVWQPHAFKVINRLGSNAIVFPNNGIYTGIFCMTTLRNYAQENPDVVKKFLNGLIEAEKFVRENPDEAIKIVANKVGMDEINLKQVFGEYTFTIKLSDTLLNALQKEGEWAVQTGIVPNGSTLPDYHSYILSQPLEKIFPERVILTTSIPMSRKRKIENTPYKVMLVE